jgi:sensor histidine kinase YesM
VHIGFWAGYILLILILLATQFVGNEHVIEHYIQSSFASIFIYIVIPSAIAFYSFYFLVFPKIQQKDIILSILYAILISLADALFGFGFQNKMAASYHVVKESNSTTVEAMLFIIFIAFVNGAVALVMRGFITWVKEIKLKEILRQKNHDMELALVKSQLDPHFLFNTINNIDVLILKDPSEASNYLNKLSDIMRFILYETKTDKILLSKELEYIAKYLELQKIRTSNSNYITYEVAGKPGNKTIAPMVFIPFIENAFKHTTNKKLNHAITIKILIEERRIQFICENKYNVSSKKQPDNNGLGNELIQKRLNLIYPEKHILKVVNQNELYSVTLIIRNG